MNGVCVKFLILILSITTFSSLATHFELRSSIITDNDSFLDLQTSQSGLSVIQISNSLDINSKELNVRIISPFNQSTKSELIHYYKTIIPVEFNAALASSGNLHNPALIPLMTKFEAALSSTNFYMNLAKELSQVGYIIEYVQFEKFTFINGEVFVAEITLRCKNAT
jgi:hypothetical protein